MLSGPFDLPFAAGRGVAFFARDPAPVHQEDPPVRQLKRRDDLLSDIAVQRPCRQVEFLFMKEAARRRDVEELLALQIFQRGIQWDRGRL